MDSTGTATADAPQPTAATADPRSTAVPDDSPPTVAPVRPALGPRFRALLVSTGAANLGDGVLQVAVPLVAVQLTRSPGQITLLTAAAWLPWLVLGVVAGVVVDRADRRHVQVAALAARTVLLAGACWLTATGGLTMTWLLVLVLAYGITEVFADLAANALVPDVVEPDLLPTANGRVVAVQEVANTFLGSPAAAALLALGAGWALGAPAGLAALALVALWRGVPGTYRHAPEAGTGTTGTTPPSTGTRGAVRRAGRDVRAGLAYVLHHRVLRPLVLAGALVNMTSTAYMSVFVLWAVGPGSRMGLSPTVYPLLLTASAVGAVLGSALTPRLLHATSEVRVMVGGWAAAFAVLLLPVAAPHPVTVVATLLVVGATATAANVVSQTLRQRIVPRAMLGRTGGATRTLAFGLMPVGAVVGGLVAERWGLAATLVGAAAAAVVVVLGFAVSMRGVTPADLAVPGVRDA